MSLYFRFVLLIVQREMPTSENGKDSSHTITPRNASVCSDGTVPLPVRFKVRSSNSVSVEKE